MKYTSIPKHRDSWWQSYRQIFVNKTKPKLIAQATPAELKMKKLLDDAGIPYIFQKPVFSRDYVAFIDFYIKKPYRICLEIDGGYHTIPEVARRDKIREQNVIRNHPWMRFVRISNEFAMSLTTNSFIRFPSPQFKRLFHGL